MILFEQSLIRKFKKENKRKAFRIEVFEDCSFEFLEFENQTLLKLRNRKGEGKITNISAAGIQLNCSYDLPIKEKILVQLTFSLHNE
jgi:c-di-GMP-binding flagellar brake protein YcgR